MVIVLEKEKYFLNEENFRKEMEKHKGKKHPTAKRNGHRCRLDAQIDIAEIIGVSRPTLNNYIKNREPIPKVNLEKLANLFGCDWEYLCGKQSYRTSPEGLMLALREVQEKTRMQKKNDKPWYEFEMSGDKLENMTVTCNKMPVQELILNIARHGGYEQILEGLKMLSDDIAAANSERNKPMSF